MTTRSKAHSRHLPPSARQAHRPLAPFPLATQPPKPGTSLSRSFGCCPSTKPLISLRTQQSALERAPNWGASKAPLLWALSGARGRGVSKCVPLFMSRSSLLVLARSLGVVAAFSLTLNAGPEAQASSPVVLYSEISRKEVRMGDHTLTLIRVRPPVLPKAPPPPAPLAATAAETPTADRLAEKAFASLNLSIAVYLGKPTVTELRWRDESGKKEYKAWSNADFRYLTQLSSLETPTTVYQWLPFVEVYNVADLPAGEKPALPKGLRLDPRGADYIVNLSARELPNEETTLAGLDYLHAYYQLHYAELKADYDKREAENAAREKELRENPPRIPDSVVRYWPIKSRVNPR